MTGLPATTGQTILTLSAAPEVLLQDDRSAAERFEDLLDLHDRALARGLKAQAEAYADRIIDEMTAGLAR